MWVAREKSPIDRYLSTTSIVGSPAGGGSRPRSGLDLAVAAAASAGHRPAPADDTRRGPGCYQTCRCEPGGHRIASAVMSLAPLPVAAVPGLARSDPHGPGITRERVEGGFRYRDPSGAQEAHGDVLERV